jgi:hypothetical protein
MTALTGTTVAAHAWTIEESMSRIRVRAAILATAAVLGAALPATAATAPLSNPRIVAHFDLARQQQPENLTVQPDGTVDLTLSFARQIAQVEPDGQVRVLATVPAPPAGTVVPLITTAFVGGIVRVPDGTIYFLYAAGTADLTGLWALPPGGTPHRITALPAEGVPNGLGLAGGYFYASDSALGTIWRIPRSGGPATAWSTAPELSAPAGTFAVNGLKPHDGAVWVTNFGLGTLIRIPIGGFGAAGPAQVKASGLGHTDDFAFAGDTAFVTTNPDDTVELVRPDGSHTTVLTAADGIQNPTSAAVRGNTLYLGDAAYFTKTDPNLLTVHIGY